MERMKRCPRCDIPKRFIEDYYHHRNGKTKGACKMCQLTWQRNRAQDTNHKYGERVDVKVPNEPYTFKNEAQRKSVETFLLAIGWKQHGVRWYKKGFCDNTGKWNKVIMKKAYIPRKYTKRDVTHN